ncbi:MAG: FHA domain-containing protein [Silvanigrellaceae bacterium]
MKAKHETTNRFVLFTVLAIATPTAFSAQERKLTVRSVDWESGTHLKIRASAVEVDASGKFPISTLDKNSFQILVDDQVVNNSQIGLTTFDSSRRWNNRAVVFAYDANGVKTMKGLNKGLRSLTAQEFASFSADFLSILGVAPKKVFERVLIDTDHQDNSLALQRRLLADSVLVSPDSVFTDSALCTAALKFDKWNSAGLKKSDQKTLILMGGSAATSSAEQIANESCVKRLLQMDVAIHQIVFARPETFLQRHWTQTPEALEKGTVFRVVDLQGAFRALQATRNILDKEYIVTAQVPQSTLQGNGKPESSLRLSALYHGIRFTSLPSVVRFSPEERKTSNVQKSDESTRKASPPPRFNSVDTKASLALNAWIEWLLTSIAIGFVVTLRHMKRMEAGIFSTEDFPEKTSSRQGPLLVMLNGKDRGREFIIRQHSVVFGRGYKCDLMIKGHGIKRRHGCISFQGDKALLEDFSNGGLAVNGRPLNKFRIIGHGSVIQLGDLQMLFTCGDS